MFVCKQICIRDNSFAYWKCKTRFSSAHTFVMVLDTEKQLFDCYESMPLHATLFYHSNSIIAPLPWTTQYTWHKWALLCDKNPISTEMHQTANEWKWNVKSFAFILICNTQCTIHLKHLNIWNGFCECFYFTPFVLWIVSPFSDSLFTIHVIMHCNNRREFEVLQNPLRQFDNWLLLSGEQKWI